MANAEGLLAIEVMVGLAPRQVWRSALDVPAGCTVAQALAQAGVWALPGMPAADQAWSMGWSVGVWGHKEPLGHVLRDGDRVELVRPLIVDPKEARRVRFRAQGDKLPRHIGRPRPKTTST